MRTHHPVSPVPSRPQEIRRIRLAQNDFGATYITRKAIMEYLATLIHCYAPLLRTHALKGRISVRWKGERHPHLPPLGRHRTAQD